MSENNVQKNYLEILKKLKTSKEEHNEEDLQLDDILDHSNILFSQISNTSELKLDAKVTEIHSDMFLKQFTQKIQDRRISSKTFINLVNENKLKNYFSAVMARNKKCSFAKFIDFDFSEEVKERKVAERISRVIKDATTPSGQNGIEEEVNSFLVKLDKALEVNSNILFFDCILDFESFDKTIENIFNVAIAIRSKKIMFSIERNMIFIRKYKETTSDEKHDSHVIMDMNYEKYLNLIDAHKKEWI